MMMAGTLRKFSILVLFVHVLGLYGQPESLFDKASEAYNQGAYDEALSYYQQILDSGSHSAALYFNMGNAHYKKNEIAPSIYYYEKALLLSPNDPEIQNNLVFARNMTLDDITPLPQPDLERFYRQLLSLFSIDGWAYTGIGFGLLFVLAYLFFLGSNTPNRKRIALIGSLVAMAFAILSTVLSLLRYQAYQKDNPAVIFAREIPVRSEPNERAEAIFLLHEGTKVQVQDSMDAWQKIELADGQVGWIPENALRLLKDF